MSDERGVPWLDGFAAVGDSLAGADRPVRVGPLAKVNLLVGRNNHGKSTILRAAGQWCGRPTRRFFADATETLVRVDRNSLSLRLSSYGGINQRLQQMWTEHGAELWRGVMAYGRRGSFHKHSDFTSFPPVARRCWLRMWCSRSRRVWCRSRRFARSGQPIRRGSELRRVPSKTVSGYCRNSLNGNARLAPRRKTTRRHANGSGGSANSCGSS